MAALKNYVDNVITAANRVTAAWLNQVDVFVNTLFNAATTAAQARTAISAAQSGANTDITSLGAVTGVTAAVDDSSTKLASTAFIAANIGGRTFVQNCSSFNASTTTSTLSGGLLQLRDRTTGLMIRLAAPANKTVNITTAGPALLGRDQVGAFTVSTPVHFYWIAKADGTLSAIASASNDATGPTLTGLTGYVYTCYDHTEMLDSGTLLLSGLKCYGNRCVYNPYKAALTDTTTNTVESALSLGPYVPVIATSTQLQVVLFGQASGGGVLDTLAELRLTSGSDWIKPRLIAATSGYTSYSYTVDIAGPNQLVYWFWLNNTNATALAYAINVIGFSVSNGGN